MHVQRFEQTWREIAESKVAEQFMASCTIQYRTPQSQQPIRRPRSGIELGSHNGHCMHATVKQVRYLELVMTLEEQHGFQPRNP